MIRRPPRSTPLYSSAASDVYKRQVSTQSTWGEDETSCNSSISESFKLDLDSSATQNTLCISLVENIPAKAIAKQTADEIIKAIVNKEKKRIDIRKLSRMIIDSLKNKTTLIKRDE
eukprot:TRINITY_DN9561_c0_g3_i6.p1 TRINITY_DN9561_c0_g3~~TRINITY_DN9561_c0_g3_i6.p1  ORF type:complete len:124 (-),score=30.49 TRINITY_DN9561_c0_g3_i6:1035-1382(-)